MLDARLLDRLSGTMSRLRRQRLHWGYLAGWLVAALLAALLLATETIATLYVVLLGIIVASACAAWFARSRPTDLRDAAHRIEAQHPDLDSRLLAAVDQQPHPETGIYGYLQMVVLGDVLLHARRNDWRRAVPTGRLWTAGLLHLAGLAAFLLVTIGLTRHRTEVLAALGVDPAARAASRDALAKVDVHPGDADVERGAGLLVTAEFSGPLPSLVEVVTRDADGNESRRPMAKSLDDPLFGVRVPEVTEDLTYRVEFDGRSSPEYSVTTFEYPRLERADARIEYPAYTGLPVEERPDVRRVSVVEGSQLTLDLQLNKPVAAANLAGNDPDQAVELSTDPANPARLTARLTPRVSQSYQLALADDAGRTSKDAIEIVVDVLPNRPPELKFAFPARDLRVSPLEEVALEGAAWDDFGLQRQGLVVQLPDGREEEVDLGRDAGSSTRATMTHQMFLEPLGVAPDELVSFYFFAEDVGPDGQPRRAFSDMFFAEIRPFLETYRQAPNQESASQQQQQQQQQQGQGGPSQQLLQLQRQIVSATWNLIRREPANPPSGKFPDDIQTLVESQQQARELAEEYAAEARDLILRESAEEAIRFMTSAAEQYQSAADGPNVSPLNDARSAARQAYQALLRLQAREHAVQNSQQSQSQSRSQQQNQRMNAQLRALELKNDRHRYETEQQARREQDAAQRESLQNLNRLEELARRQEDLNERVRQLENSLRNARTEAERQELQRQLKRLQEEQQELLRDVDELRERMNRPEQRPQSADAREALDQTRERMFQSAEALRQQQTSRALAEGTRAQRELNQLKEEFRQQTSGRFNDDVRQLRDDVRRLADQQNQIGQELTRGQPPAGQEPQPARQRPSLREQQPQQDRSDLTQRLSEQQRELSEILNRMRSLVQDAETSEPLLSNRLYETMRSVRTDRPDEALAATSELLRRGFEEPAQQAEAQARSGINRLRTGVEQAAEGVLGNETEALRRAREELAQLTEALARELARNDEQFARERQSPAAQEQASGERRPGGDPAERDPQSNDPGAQGSSQPGEQPPQPGEPAAGGSRPGENDPSTQPRDRTGSARGPAGDDRSRQMAPRPEGAGQPGEQPSEQTPSDRQAQNQPGQNQPGQNQPGQNQPGQNQPGQNQPGQNQPGQSFPSSESRSPSPATASGRGGRTDADSRQRMINSLAAETQGGGNTGPHDPLTGEEFVDWSDRLREVEEMVGDPRLRADLAAVRERARAMRIEFKRHSKQPNWELVRTSIYGPLRELEQRLAEELARRSPDDRLVPIDRDPVPDQFAELVRRYYEELSRQP